MVLEIGMFPRSRGHICCRPSYYATTWWKESYVGAGEKEGVCVCERERQTDRERERERDRDGGGYIPFLSGSY
jgi:hypothetical protein